MKLRLRHNSLRLRVGRSEVASFLESGIVEDSVDFPSIPLVYILHSSDECKEIQASFMNGWVTVSVPKDQGRAWAEGDTVGMQTKYRGISILIEKDFACTHPSSEGEEDENSDVYPHPQTSAGL
jgi:hypothetical protein